METKAINLFTDTPEMCENFSFKSAHKLIRGTFVCMFLKYVSAEILIPHSVS